MTDIRQSLGNEEKGRIQILTLEELARLREEHERNGNVEVRKPKTREDEVKPEEQGGMPLTYFGNKFRELTITDKGDFWEVRGKYENGEVYTPDLSKTLLPSMTQDALAKLTGKARKTGDFGALSMRDYHVLFSALHALKDKKEAEDAKKLLRKVMRENYPLTLTRIRYNPSAGSDEVVYDYGLSNTTLREAIVGPDEQVLNSTTPKALKAIIGTDNLQQIHGVYNWINETPVYIWRVNANPQSIDERVAGFGAGSGRAGWGCDRYPADANPALGVRLRQKI